MVQLGSPGVYVVEASSGVRPIAAVATSIAAFIDYFSEGPVDRAVQIFGLADFERIFGGLNAKSEASYAIRQFFANGGSSAWVVRTSGGLGATAASTAMQNVITQTAATTVFTAKAANPGEWGSYVRLVVTYDGNGTATSAGTFTLVVRRYASNGKELLASERYLGLSVDTLSETLDIVNQGSQLVALSNAGTLSSSTPSDDNPATNGTLGGAIASGALGNSAGKLLEIKIGTGTTTSTRTVTLPATAATTYQELRNFVQAAIRSAPPTSGTPDEWDAAFRGVTVELVGTSLLVRTNPRAATYTPAETIAFADAAAGDLKLAAADAVVHPQEHVMSTTGGDGDPPKADAITSALSLLEKVDLFNMMCVPRTADLADAAMVSAVSACLTFCKDHRAMLFVDIPKEVQADPVKIQDWLEAHDSFRDKNSVIYFPRLQVPDPLNGFRPRPIGASGTMAGLFSRTDTERGVWKAPAGVDAKLRGLSELTYKLSDAENGVLNPIAINCLRTFPIYGAVAWGARTLDGADVAGSEWKYIPIRRLALMIEESLFRGTKWVTFEPNDEPLWARIRQNVGAFMLGLYRQGAFQGDSPKKAFYVKCDAETTTANDRNLGIVNIQVGFAPLKPAEFVVITIQQIPDIVS